MGGKGEEYGRGIGGIGQGTERGRKWVREGQRIGVVEGVGEVVREGRGGGKRGRGQGMRRSQYTLFCDRRKCILCFRRWMNRDRSLNPYQIENSKIYRKSNKEIIDIITDIEIFNYFSTSKFIALLNTQNVSQDKFHTRYIPHFFFINCLMQNFNCSCITHTIEMQI